MRQASNTPTLAPQNRRFDGQLSTFSSSGLQPSAEPSPSGSATPPTPATPSSLGSTPPTSVASTPADSPAAKRTSYAPWDGRARLSTTRAPAALRPSAQAPVVAVDRSMAAPAPVRFVAADAGRKASHLLAAQALVGRAAGRKTPAREASILACFDGWARANVLEQNLAELVRLPRLPALLEALIPLARVQDEAPRIFAHRGLVTEQVENTIGAARAAFDAGADGVEIDLALVRGDFGGYQTILRHDIALKGWSIDSMTTSVRNLGGEAWMYGGVPLVARPKVPPLYRRRLREASHTLRLSEYRKHYGYIAPQGLDTHMPTFAEFTQFLRRERFTDKDVFLDIKLPADMPLLTDAMAALIDEAVVAAGLDKSRFVVASFSQATMQRLRDTLGPAYRYSLGSCLTGPWATPDEAQVLGDARSSSAMAHVGHYLFGSDATLIEVLRRDAPAMAREGRALGVWTVNDPLYFRKLLGAGKIDLVISDTPQQLAQHFRAMRNG